VWPRETADPADARARAEERAARNRPVARGCATSRARELTRDIAPGATIEERWRQLAGEYPNWTHERSISSAVNADYARRIRC
jgi:hypothetical protein